RALDGERIESTSDWTCRRAEISAQAQAYELGPKPPRPEHVSGMLEGDALVVSVEEDGRAIEFTATLTHPDTGESPFPAMIVLGGVTALDADSAISGEGVTMIQFPHEVIAAQDGNQSYGQGLFFEIYGPNHAAGALAAW